MERYSRQIRLSQVGKHGQERLQQSHIAIVGCGALGSFQAGALARAGIGRLTLIDRDYVEISNLQRQWLYTEADALDALPKAVAAMRSIQEINSACEVVPAVADLTADTAEDLFEGVHLIIDGTDNFETRFLINDFCVKHSVPWIYGGAVGTYGISMPVIPGRTACLRCLYPDAPGAGQPTCETAGVLNTITSLVASWQVSHALRWLVSGEVSQKVTTFEAWDGSVRQIPQPEPDPECPTCARHEFRHLQAERRTPVSLCGRNAVQIHDRERPVDLRRLSNALAAVGAVRANEFALQMDVPPYQLTVFPDGRAIIKGTTDVGIARSLYSKYVGN